MTEKEWKIIDEEFISYTGGTAQLISNGECKVHLWETPKDAQLFCDKLNEQHEQIERLKRNFKALDEVKCEIADENEQLKDENKDCAKRYRGLFNKYIKLQKENKTLKEEKETYKTLYEEMSYYFRDGVTLRDLDHKDFHSLQRLAKGLVD